MKKVFAVLLVLVMSITFFGCGSDKSDAPEENSQNVVDTMKPTDGNLEEEKTETPTEPTTEPVTEPKTEPATEPKTEPATEPKTEPAKPTCEHNYSNGVCTVCGNEHPDAPAIREILKKCERYVNYLDIEADILETRVQLYKSNKDPSVLVEIQESVIEIDEYYANIRKLCEPYKKTYLYGMYSEANRDMPVVQSTALSKVSTYARHAGMYKDFYDSACSKWGV